MPVPREKEQDHQRVQQRARHGHVGLGAGIVNLVHGHAHLGVNRQSGHLWNIEEKVHHHAQGKPHRQLQQHRPRKGQHPRWRLQPSAFYRVGKGRQQQRKSRAEHPGKILAAQQGVEQNKATHPGQNQQEERQGPFVYHRRLR